MVLSNFNTASSDFEDLYYKVDSKKVQIIRPSQLAPRSTMSRDIVERGANRLGPRLSPKNRSNSKLYILKDEFVHSN